MKSNICKIEKGTKDLEAILEESERARAVGKTPDGKQGKWQFLLFATAGILVCVIGWISRLFA